MLQSYCWVVDIIRSIDEWVVIPEILIRGTLTVNSPTRILEP